MVIFESLSDEIKAMARKYRDIALKPDYRYISQLLIYAEYTEKDRDLKVGKVGLDYLKKLNDKDKKMLTSSKWPMNQFRIQYNYTKKDEKTIKDSMSKHFNWETVNPSGIFLIPTQGGFFGWHTNANKTMPRLYIVWVEKENSSSFYLSKDGKNRRKERTKRLVS